MIEFINSVSSVVGVILGEITTCVTYFDSYPILYYILLLSLCLEAVIVFKFLIKL